MVHGSDSVESAKRELSIWFPNRPQFGALSQSQKNLAIAATEKTNEGPFEQTLILLKPDAIVRGKVGDIYLKFASVGLDIAKMEMVMPEKHLLESHYAEHKGKPFYDGLMGFVSSGPVIKMLIQGTDAILRSRKIIKFVRETMSMSGRMNLVHGSDSEESAKREIGLWFPN